MPDCPHTHIQDSGLQAFKDAIHEETDGGRTIARFLNQAMEGELPDFEPQHRLDAAKTLAKYGHEEAAEYVQRNSAPRHRRASNGSGSGSYKPDRDPIMKPVLSDMARAIREETNNGLSIVRNLIQIMEAREKPFKPHHNLEAAKQLIDNGYPLTDALICAPDCSHHSVTAEGAAESDPALSAADGGAQDETVPDPKWLETLAEIKRMEDEGEIPRVEYDPFNPKSPVTGTEEEIRPYAAEVAAAFRAELELQDERRAKWPEIEEHRQKKLAQIYPSHSDGDPPET